jgi:hypothetical protein
MLSPKKLDLNGEGVDLEVRIEASPETALLLDPLSAAPDLGRVAEAETAVLRMEEFSLIFDSLARARTCAILEGSRWFGQE